MEEMAHPGHRFPRLHFILGCLAAVLLLAGLAEVFLRWFPPADLHPFLGEQSPLTGIYRPDADFAVTYRSWEDFCTDNAARLKDYVPFERSADPRPLWAMFGNSFVQAPGMLADTARQALPDHRIFNLGRNELPFVRLAQIKLLLEHGLRPERIFVEFMPVDVLPLGPQPLDTVRVTTKGALTYEPRLPPGPAGWLVRHSRVALTAWVRAGRQHGNPGFKSGRVYEGVGEPLRGDLARLFGNLARLGRQYHVPVTVVLIPAYHQVVRGDPCGFQHVLGDMLRGYGLDVFDPRAAFIHFPNAQSLFLPDLHFNEAGNRLLLAELLKHLQRLPAPVAVAREVRRP